MTCQLTEVFGVKLALGCKCDSFKLNSVNYIVCKSSRLWVVQSTNWLTASWFAVKLPNNKVQSCSNTSSIIYVIYVLI